MVSSVPFFIEVESYFFGIQLAYLKLQRQVSGMNK